MEKAEPTHGRGQLEIALWQTFTQGDQGQKVDRTFKGRIQKLLDLDRAGSAGDAPAPFAFHEEEPRGRGQEVRYSLIDCFCLAIGLDLLDLGFKQSEVVFLLRHLRNDLSDKLVAIRSDPPVLRASLDHGDKRLFMVLRKVEMIEAFGTSSGSSGPLILKPLFLSGASGLAFLADLGFSDRARIVLEIAELAVLLELELSKAPDVKRGRRT